MSHAPTSSAAIQASRHRRRLRLASLAGRLGAAELTENPRQRNPLQRRVADLHGRGQRTRGDRGRAAVTGVDRRPDH
jgi:hypothetical protein